MTQKTLLLLRGVQGCGKTTLAETLVELGKPDAVCYCADDYFYRQSDLTGRVEYLFDPDKLHYAHKQCFASTKAAMADGKGLVMVHNTFSRASELTPYIKLAQEFQYRPVSIVVENRHGSKDVHNVPQEVREEFASRIKSSLKLV